MSPAGLEAPDAAILLTLHAAPADGIEVVVAQQVQDGVHDVADQLARGGCAELPRLCGGVIEADEGLPVKRGVGILAVIERDDVG